MEKKEIYFAPGYFVTSEGKVFDPEGNEVKSYDQNGYRSLKLRLPTDDLMNVRLHRLVGIFFVENTKPGIRTEINHFDLDKTNNSALNLEWVTGQENVLHASLCRGTSKRKHTEVRNKDTGEAFLSCSFDDIVEKTGLDRRYVWNIILGIKEDKVWSIQYLGSLGRVPEEFHKVSIPVRDSHGKNPKVSIKIKDLQTGMISHYESFLQAAKAIGVIHTAIRNALIVGDKIRSFGGRYIVVKEDDDFPDVDLDYIRKHKGKREKEVVALNTIDGKVTIYPTIIMFSEAINVKARLIAVQLANQDVIMRGSWVFTKIRTSSFEAVKRIFAYLGNTVSDEEVVQALSSL